MYNARWSALESATAGEAENCEYNPQSFHFSRQPDGVAYSYHPIQGEQYRGHKTSPLSSYNTDKFLDTVDQVLPLQQFPPRWEFQ